jgi:hypothetical protein
MDAQSLPAGLTIHSLREMVACVERPMTCAYRHSSCAITALAECSKMTASSFVKHQNPETNDAFHATVHGCRRKAYPVRSRMNFPAAACSAEVATPATEAGSHGGSWKRPSLRQSSKIARTNGCQNSDSNSHSPHLTANEMGRVRGQKFEV